MVLKGRGWRGRRPSWELVGTMFSLAGYRYIAKAKERVDTFCFHYGFNSFIQLYVLTLKQYLATLHVHRTDLDGDERILFILCQ